MADGWTGRWLAWHWALLTGILVLDVAAHAGAFRHGGGSCFRSCSEQKKKRQPPFLTFTRKEGAKESDKRWAGLPAKLLYIPTPPVSPTVKRASSCLSPPHDCSPRWPVPQAATASVRRASIRRRMLHALDSGGSKKLDERALLPYPSHPPTGRRYLLSR